MKKVLLSTLLGSIALVVFIFVISLLDKELWSELVENGVFHIGYSLVMIVPFLAVFFYLISYRFGSERIGLGLNFQETCRMLGSRVGTWLSLVSGIFCRVFLNHWKGSTPLSLQVPRKLYIMAACRAASCDPAKR